MLRHIHTCTHRRIFEISNDESAFSSGFFFFKKRKRLGGSSGSVGGEGVSLKESPVVVLTPDASSRCESLFPQRVISALLLLMLLLLRRFSMIRKERKRDREKLRDGERERE